MKVLIMQTRAIMITKKMRNLLLFGGQNEGSDNVDKGDHDN